MVDGDGFDTLLAQFVEQLGDTGLDVVGNLLATFLFAEGGTERLNVLLQPSRKAGTNCRRPVSILVSTVNSCELL